MSEVRVVVADERPLARAALAAGLRHADGVRVLAAVGCEAETLRACRESPHVVVIGEGHAGRSAETLCAAVKQVVPAPRVLVLGDRADERLLRSAVLAGADGFASTAVDVPELVVAIRRVADGQAVIPPAMLGTLLRDLASRRREHTEVLQRFMTLTNRERQVLELLADGCDREAVADILVISPQTARTHIQNVLQKLGVNSRLRAAAVAIEFGLVEQVTYGNPVDLSAAR